MSTTEVEDLKNAMNGVKEEVSLLKTVSLKFYREALLTRKALRSCQSHCHVRSQNKWRNLWIAIRGLFTKIEIQVVDLDVDVDREMSEIEHLLGMGLGAMPQGQSS